MANSLRNAEIRRILPQRSHKTLHLQVDREQNIAGEIDRTVTAFLLEHNARLHSVSHSVVGLRGVVPHCLWSLVVTIVYEDSTEPVNL